MQATDGMVAEVRDQFVATLIDHPLAPGLATVTKTKLANRAFDDQWSSLESRLTICPGKAVLSQLNRLLQASHQVSLSPTRIVSHMKVGDIPPEMRALLRGLEAFRRTPTS